MKEAFNILLALVIWGLGLFLIAKGAWILCAPVGMIVAGLELIVIAVAITGAGGD